MNTGNLECSQVRLGKESRSTLKKFIKKSKRLKLLCRTLVKKMTQITKNSLSNVLEAEKPSPKCLRSKIHWMNFEKNEKS